MTCTQSTLTREIARYRPYPYPKLFYKMKEKMQAVQYNINKQRITAIFLTLSLLGRKCADRFNKTAEKT